ncbi:MAG: hypothetical protein FJX61_08110 [Alphaproteobacteria bacterium]|nr:hypothetical protein [Alphaproteobacteria bacterium]
MALAPLAAPARAALIEPGDIAPGFRLPSATGASVDLDDPAIAGRFALLVFGTGAELAATMQALALHRGALDRARAALFAIGGTGAGDSGVPTLEDRDGAVGRSYGVNAANGMAVIAIAPNRHVLAAGQGGKEELASLVTRVAGAIAAWAPAFTPHPQDAIHAPVLVVPDVLSSDECQRLIAVFRLEGNEFLEPGHGEQQRSVDYKMRIPEYGRGDRIDHWVMNPATNAWIDRRLRERLFPEIRKAFHFPVTRREFYRIGCYEGARGGELHGHRDNTEPHVAHRRFAMSINLNTEAFAGGELVYPEFGGQRYRPASGAAIVFSSSLLHEVLEVTSGRRFVLLAFLFGER